MAKKNPQDMSVEERLKTLFQLQTTLSAIDEKKALTQGRHSTEEWRDS